MRVIFLLFYLFATVDIFAQDNATAQNSVNPQDTVKEKPFDIYWTKQRIVPKAGIAVQETTSLEAGIAYHRIFVHPLSLSSMSAYLTAEAMLRDDNFVFGPKIGYEFTVSVIGVAADVTYYTDTHRESFVFTPKAGLSLFGFANLFYGRNLQISNDYFNIISKNKVSLTFNFNRDYFDLKGARKRR